MIKSQIFIESTPPEAPKSQVSSRNSLEKIIPMINDPIPYGSKHLLRLYLVLIFGIQTPSETVFGAPGIMIVFPDFP